MSKSVALKILILSVAIIAIYILLFVQRNDIDLTRIFAGVSGTSTEQRASMENIMPEPMLADIKEKIKEEEQQIEANEDEVVKESTNEQNEKDTSDADDATESVTTDYIKVTDACGPYYGGDCLNVRAGPSTSAGIQTKLRNGQVLKIEDNVEGDGMTWYKVIFDEWIRHPERLNGDWYVAADFVEPVSTDSLDKPAQSSSTEPVKRIVVDLSEQMLYAYEGEEIYMQEPVSTGLVGSLTPRGTFKVFYRTPSRYMQGPIPEITDDEYDLPGVPWNLYFTEQGAVIHGAYWHDNFGQNWSHGCVNLPPEKAEMLYAWTPVGTEVTVQD